MGGRSGSQVRRRVLARELRGLREAAGLTLEDAAARLDIAPSTLSRSESGQQQISVHVVKSMLDVYEADDRWDELLRLARASRQRGWCHAFGPGDRTTEGTPWTPNSTGSRAATAAVATAAASRSRSCPPAAWPCATPRTAPAPRTSTPPPPGPPSSPPPAPASSSAADRPTPTGAPI